MLTTDFEILNCVFGPLLLTGFLIRFPVPSFTAGSLASGFLSVLVFFFSFLGRVGQFLSLLG
jgi:hypothetical protein